MIEPIESLGYLLMRVTKDKKVFYKEMTETAIQIDFKRKTILKIRGKYDPVKIPLTDLERDICEGMLNA